MGISTITAPGAGNALKLYITQHPRAVYWRVLRRTKDAFTGPTDGGAVMVASRTTDVLILDTEGLVNNQPYFYHTYGWINGAWVDEGPSYQATPAATYVDMSVDTLAVVQERLALGLAVEVARDVLKPESHVIRVHTSPFAMTSDMTFPCVNVHYDRFTPQERFIGDEVFRGIGDDDEWHESEGFNARAALNITAVSKNPDERIELRKSLTRILLANFPVFAAKGMSLIEFAFADSEQIANPNAPLFMTGGSFTCQHLNWVMTEPQGALRDIQMTAHIHNDPEPYHG